MITLSTSAIRPRPLAVVARASRGSTASSIEPARYSGAISVVGQPNANTGMVGYPSRPSGRTPLAALASSSCRAQQRAHVRLAIVDAGPAGRGARSCR